jgi:hypothetical protein
MWTHLTLDASDGLAVAALGVSLVGIVVSMAALWNAVRDLDALVVAHLNGPRALVARTGIRREATRLVLQVLLGVIALITVSMPEIPQTMPADVIVLIGVRNLLRLTVALSLTVSSIWDIVDRHRLVALLHDPKHAHHHARIGDPS